MSAHDPIPSADDLDTDAPELTDDPELTDPRGPEEPAPGDEGGPLAPEAPEEWVPEQADVDARDSDGAGGDEFAAEGADGQGVDADSDLDADADSESESESDDHAGESDGDAGAPVAKRAGGRRRMLEREGEVAADFLETLLDIADLDGDIDLDVDGDRAIVAVVDSEEGRVPRRLVGPNGKVLESLQELTRLAVQSATGERSRLMLDVAGFRAERRSELVEQARTAIEQCRSTGEPVELDPMSAFERKVVHDEVLAAGLMSESSGVEPRRYVVVLPATA